MIHLPCLQPAAYADDWLAWKVSTHPRGMLCPSPEGTRRVRTGSRERHGWQHEASSRVEREHRERRILHRLADNEKAMLRSQRSRSWIGSLCHPVQSLLSDAASLVPGVAAAPPPSAPPSCLSHLPMWPSNRRAWPPSRSVHQSRSIGGGGASPSRALPPGCREGGARVSSNVTVKIWT